MKRIIILAACLLTAGPALGTDMFSDVGEPGRTPARLVRLDGLDIGAVGVLNVYPPVLLRMANVTVTLNGVRFGVSCVDGFVSLPSEEGSCAMVLPLHAGYTLYSAPKKTCLFWSHLADVYIEASGSLLANSFSGPIEPGFKATLCADAEYYGLGTGIEVGWASIPTADGFGRLRASRASFFYAALQLRFVTFGIGF